MAGGGPDNRFGQVVRVDPTSGARTVASAVGIGGINGIVVESTGQIIVFEAYRVLRVNPTSGAWTIVSAATTGSGPPLDQLTCMAIDASGQLIAAGGLTGGGYSVVRIDPQTGARTALFSVPGPSGPSPPGPIHGLGIPYFRGIAVEPSGQIITVMHGDKLVRIDPKSGTLTTISTGANYSIIAVETSGHLVARSDQSLLRVDLRNDARAIISR